MNEIVKKLKSDIGINKRLGHNRVVLTLDDARKITNELQNIEDLKMIVRVIHTWAVTPNALNSEHVNNLINKSIDLDILKND